VPVFEHFIDAHSHVWTPDTAAYPLAAGFKPEDMSPRSFTAEELLAVCRPAGVGRVNLIQMSYYGYDNRYMLDMIRRYPDRFVGTAMIDPAGPDPAKEMADLLVRGVKAFRIQLAHLGLPIERWLDHPAYEAMFSKAAETKQVLSFLVDPPAFPEIDRMAAKHPGAPVIIDHMGRIGVDGQVRDPEVAMLCALARHPQLYVKVGAFYALGQKQPPYDDLGPMIEKIVGAFGANRCVWESDCPFQVVEHRYLDSLSLVRDRLPFLDAEEKDWLLRGTAEQLLFQAL
jgi:predicted TIM-barrel fold metal-dependent hydrolase